MPAIYVRAIRVPHLCAVVRLSSARWFSRIDLGHAVAANTGMLAVPNVSPTSIPHRRREHRARNALGIAFDQCRHRSVGRDFADYDEPGRGRRGGRLGRGCCWGGLDAARLQGAEGYVEKKELGANASEANKASNTTCLLRSAL